MTVPASDVGWLATRSFLLMQVSSLNELDCYRRVLLCFFAIILFPSNYMPMSGDLSSGQTSDVGKECYILDWSHHDDATERDPMYTVLLVNDAMNIMKTEGP